MSLYQYSCDDHGPFDIEAKFGNPPTETDCPICEEPARRDFVVPEIRFRGTGWTVKDKSHEFSKKFPTLDRMSR